MPDQPPPVIYDGDTRYPGPLVHPPPEYIKGIPTQGELDAQARMFTWGELKEIIKSGDLELLMRNKKMQARYDTWMQGIKGEYGSTEAYLTQARLPWANSNTTQDKATVSPTYPTHLHLDTTTTTTDPLPARSQTPISPHLEPPIPTSPTSYPYPPPPMSPTGEPSPNLADPNGGLKLDIPGSKGPRRHGRTPSITVSPSDAAPRILLPQGEDPENRSEVVLNSPPQTHKMEIPSGNSSTKASPRIDPISQAVPGSGSSTPSSVGFVSLSSLNLVNGKLKKTRSRTSTLNKSTSHLDLDAVRNAEGGGQEEEDEDGGEKPEYLRWEGWMDGDKYAVLPNDWPYNVPTGVRHYCVWSRIPIAHPDLVDYSPEAWSKIESEGLGGFTGVTPLFRRRQYPTYTPQSASPSPSPPDSGINTPAGAGAGAGGAGRTKNLGHLEQDEWYAVDCDYSGSEKRKWAGVGYECAGGAEVGRMVKGLWDERGWECLWFVNPPRLQSVPGFSHFHVFARRKTPEEIDAAEAAMKAGQKRGLKTDGQSAVPVI